MRPSPFPLHAAMAGLCRRSSLPHEYEDVQPVVCASFTEAGIQLLRRKEWHSGEGGCMKRGLAYRAVSCLLIGASFILPVCIIQADSIMRHGAFRVHDAVLDLSGWSGEGVVPLDGSWEFFWDEWIISDGLDRAEPDALIELPDVWTKRGHSLSGIASYRLHVKHCPEGVGFQVRVPNSQTPYKVFIDGKLALQGEYPDKDPGKIEVRSEINGRGVKDVQPQSCDVVIEVASAATGGLYVAPQLEAVREATVNPTLVAYAQSAVLGGLAVFVVAFAAIAVFRNEVFRSGYLVLLTIALVCIVLSCSEIMRLKIVKIIGAHYEYVWFIKSATVAVFPLLLTCCIRMLFRDSGDASRWIDCATRFFAMASCVIFLMLSSAPWREAFLVEVLACAALCVVACAPIFREGWCKGDLDAVLFPSSAAVLMSALAVDALYDTGRLVVNASLVFGISAVFFAAVTFVIYVRRMAQQERRALELEQVRYRLKEAEVSLMFSQIRPHFLYNSLTAIVALISLNPELAQSALQKFACYLRVNIDTAKEGRMIPFREELDHIKVYLDIEKLRFDDRLRTRFEISDVDFCVPQLSIQPLVENAVKHGVCKKEEGGTVLLRTHFDGSSHCVEIVDDGVGFDVRALEEESSGSIGIGNVTYRLKSECAAEVGIESAPGMGCRVSVRIPVDSSVAESVEVEP